MLAIKVQNLTKVYPLYNSPRDRLKEALHPFRKKYHHDFYALKDISFEVQKGETVGILGQNGSGKSTLLKIITGVLSPTSGSVEVKGRISSLLELGTGFNPELTGIENIYFYGTINGFSREEMDNRLDSILGFADIGEFIYQPVKTYSSGMFVRLAFACAIQIEPDVLIVDEALAVGDARFQARCFDRLNTIIKRGCTLLLVTHSTEQIVTHCKLAVLLNKGNLIKKGEPKLVVNTYLDILFGKERSIETTKNKAKLEEINLLTQSKDINLSLEKDIFYSRPGYNPLEYRWGDGKAKIIDYNLLVDGVLFPNSIELGQKLRLEICVKFNEPIMSPIIGITIKSKEGITLSGSNSEIQDSEDFRSYFINGSILIAFIEFKCNLGGGDYFVSLGIATKNGEEIVPHDRRYDAIHLVIRPDKRFYGLFDINLNLGLIYK